jgi:hypothetical protein
MFKHKARRFSEKGIQNISINNDRSYEKILLKLIAHIKSKVTSAVVINKLQKIKRSITENTHDHVAARRTQSP